MISVERLSCRYGAVQALTEVSLETARGEWICILGSNGAGKSTLLKAIAGLVPAVAGCVRFQGDDITAWTAESRAERGMRLVPEGRGVFESLSVEENLAIGAWLLPSRRERESAIARAFELFPRLRERRDQPGQTLSGGEQQMLAIARAWIASPALLLLDEPSLGLAPQLTRSIFESLKSIHSSGTTLILVEQNTRLALQYASRALVLRQGRIALAGTAAEIGASEALASAYLG